MDRYPAALLDWEGLEPRGFYARRGRVLLRLFLLVATLLPALAIGLPIFLVNACLFRSPRLAFYSQPRTGHRGRVFRILKFRTMRPSPCGDFDSWGRGLDPLRVTRFGRFLRNTHLDELPQLWNIWRGEMDFIGPRPEMIEVQRWACERLPRFPERCALLPGVTGLAQVTQGYAGKDARAYAQKLAADQHYRRRLSFALDLEILLRTALWLLGARGLRRSPRRRVVGERPA
jgi:lipopolysaccharide/colanic/teichoic acid biosynthesis glycosyltransferase